MGIVSRGLEQSEQEADYLPSAAEVKNVWGSYLHSCIFMACCLIRKFYRGFWFIFHQTDLSSFFHLNISCQSGLFSFFPPISLPFLVFCISFLFLFFYVCRQTLILYVQYNLGNLTYMGPRHSRIKENDGLLEKVGTNLLSCSAQHRSFRIYYHLFILHT
jgi:hypothetical protein